MRAPADPADRTGVRLPPPLIFLAGILAGWAVGQWRPLPIPGGTLLPIMAGLWIAAGCALVLWGVVAFRRAGTTLNPFGGTRAIVAGGPYRYTRNPMYAGLACVHVGAALAMRNGWVLVMLVPVLLIVDRHVIRREERYLERRHGIEWESYTRKVRRWI